MDINQNFVSTASLFNLHINEQTWEDVAEYKCEYAMVIRQREECRMAFVHRSPQILYRDYLVNYVKDVAIVRELAHCTLHLAVYIMDIFMDNHSINSDRILLVANCCVLIAAKIEESKEKLPRIDELNAHVPFPYPAFDYQVLETRILRHFDWFVMFPTAAHYVHYFLQAAIDHCDVVFKQQTVARIIHDMHTTIRTYLDKVLDGNDDVHYMQFHKPSLLAAAIIAIARRLNGMEEWNDQLTVFTLYRQSDIGYTKMALLETLPLPCIECTIGIKHT